jgi:hypothetical protein
MISTVVLTLALLGQCPAGCPTQVNQPGVVTQLPVVPGTGLSVSPPFYWVYPARGRRYPMYVFRPRDYWYSIPTPVGGRPLSPIR